MSAKIDLTGNKYSKLTVIREAGRNNRNQITWECLCSCGNVKIVVGTNLKNGSCRSCGCLRSIVRKGKALKHGKVNTPEYEVWHGIKQRILNPNNDRYKHYGGRGITLDPAWLKFENFFKDMGKRPVGINGEKYSIDRKNNNKGYNKDNCRWTTLAVQSNNKQNSIYVTYKNTTRTLSQWAAILKINKTTLGRRIRDKTLTVEQAMFDINPKEKLVTYQKQTKSITKWAREFNLKPSFLIQRLNKGWTIDKAINTPPKQSTKYEHNGQLKTLKEIETETRINSSTLYSRLKRGLTMREAVIKNNAK